MGRLNLAQCYGKVEFSLKKWTIDLERLKRKIAFGFVFIHFSLSSLKEEARNERAWIRKCLALINPYLSSLRLNLCLCFDTNLPEDPGQVN